MVGFEGCYEVSDQGRVRSLDRKVEALNRWGKVTARTYAGRVLRPHTNQKRGGYRYVVLHDAEGQHSRRVSVLVAAAFTGSRPEGMQVCHRNGVSDDDRAVNLRYDTPKANMADKHVHGTYSCGENHPTAKLSNADAAEIRRLRNVVPKKVLAARFGVSPGHINNVQCGLRHRA